MHMANFRNNHATKRATKNPVSHQTNGVIYVQPALSQTTELSPPSTHSAACHTQSFRLSVFRSRVFSRVRLCRSGICLGHLWDSVLAGSSPCLRVQVATSLDPFLRPSYPSPLVASSRRLPRPRRSSTRVVRALDSRERCCLWVSRPRVRGCDRTRSSRRISPRFA